jgi:hypothetical protein
MPLFMSMSLAKPLAGPDPRTPAYDLFKRLTRAFGALGLGQVYVFSTDSPLASDYNARDLDRECSHALETSDALELTWESPWHGRDAHAQLGFKPDATRDERLTFEASFEVTSGPRRANFHPVCLYGPIPDIEEKEFRARVEQLIHLFMPQRISLKWVPDGSRRPVRPWDWPFGGDLVYLDAATVRGLQDAQEGFHFSATDTGGSWVRAHDEPIDSKTERAEEAGRRLDNALWRYERAKMKPLRDAVEREREKKKQQQRPPTPEGSLIAPLAPLAAAASSSPGPDRAVPVQRAPVIAPPIANADPDATLLPGPAKGPVLPFSGTTSPERLRALMPSPPAPPGPAVGEPPGETVVLADANLSRQVSAALAARQVDGVTVERYAALRAALSLRGEDDPETLQRFGLDRETKERVKRGFFERFQRDPKLQEQFGRLLSRELARLRGEG